MKSKENDTAKERADAPNSTNGQSDPIIAAAKKFADAAARTPVKRRPQAAREL